MINYSNLPEEPGCYLYKDVNNKIIYIGKAKNLKKRVSSYFTKKEQDNKTVALVNNIHHLDYIVTDNEVEALILENNLIKENKPKYNIALKDSKRYAFIEITGEKFPRLVISREKSGKGEYFGPFVSSHERDYILEFLIKTFKMRTCRKLPKKECLRYHINLCNAPCIGLISEKDYGEIIERVRNILKGNIEYVMDELSIEMKNASHRLEFEISLQLRNIIDALKVLEEKQNMERNRTCNEDIINYIIHNGHVYLFLFNIYRGNLINKEEFVFQECQDFLEEFLLQYYSENEIPEEIILPHNIDKGMTDFINYKKNCRIIIPKAGERKELLDFVKKNIEISCFGDMIKVQELQKALCLDYPPYVIECFDISHLSGTLTVGAMVQFRDGKPDKSNYRRFKINTSEADDFKSMGEVIRRRYGRIKKENLTRPDLIVIDGGKGQLNSALEELGKLSMDIPIISIAKRFEEIYLPGLDVPLRLDKKDKALLFIREIRDETHRFAIGYNRLLRKRQIKEK